MFKFFIFGIFINAIAYAGGGVHGANYISKLLSDAQMTEIPKIIKTVRPSDPLFANSKLKNFYGKVRVYLADDLKNLSFKMTSDILKDSNNGYETWIAINTSEGIIYYNPDKYEAITKAKPELKTVIKYVLHEMGHYYKLNEDKAWEFANLLVSTSTSVKLSEVEQLFAQNKWVPVCQRSAPMKELLELATDKSCSEISVKDLSEIEKLEIAPSREDGASAFPGDRFQLFYHGQNIKKEYDIDLKTARFKSGDLDGLKNLNEIWLQVHNTNNFPEDFLVPVANTVTQMLLSVVNNTKLSASFLKSLVRVESIRLNSWNSAIPRLLNLNRNFSRIKSISIASDTQINPDLLEGLISLENLKIIGGAYFKGLKLPQGKSIKLLTTNGSLESLQDSLDQVQVHSLTLFYDQVSLIKPLPALGLSEFNVTCPLKNNFSDLAQVVTNNKNSLKTINYYSNCIHKNSVDASKWVFDVNELISILSKLPNLESINLPYLTLSPLAPPPESINMLNCKGSARAFYGHGNGRETVGEALVEYKINEGPAGLAMVTRIQTGGRYSNAGYIPRLGNNNLTFKAKVTRTPYSREYVPLNPNEANNLRITFSAATAFIENGKLKVSRKYDVQSPVKPGSPPNEVHWKEEFDSCSFQ